jgi:hypothetical protein
MAVASADGRQERPGTSPALARRASHVCGVPAHLVLLTAEHRDHLTAVTDDLAPHGAALEDEPSVRLRVVVARGKGGGLGVPDVGASCHVSRFDGGGGFPTEPAPTDAISEGGPGPAQARPRALTPPWAAAARWSGLTLPTASGNVAPDRIHVVTTAR